MLESPVTRTGFFHFAALDSLLSFTLPGNNPYGSKEPLRAVLHRKSLISLLQRQYNPKTMDRRHGGLEAMQRPRDWRICARL
jgi:hypothetical protein